MSGRGKGGSYPGGRKDRQSEKKKGSEKRKHSGNNHSGLTPTNKAPVQQDPRGTLGSPLEVAPSATGNGGPGASSINEPRNEEKNLNLSGSDRQKAPSPAPSETSSVTARIGDAQLDDKEVEKLLAEDNELGDLSQEEEQAIAQKAMEVDGDETGANVQPPKTYAKAANPAPAIRGFEVIYVHYGTKERAALSEALFYKLWDRIDTMTVGMIVNGEEVPDGMCLWKRWKQDRGLICVKDEESSKFVCKLVNQTKVKGHSFRAWHRGEFGEGRLVTGFLGGSTFQSRSGEDIVKVLFKQNSLRGRTTGVVTKDDQEGRLLKFFADKELWQDLMSRRVSEANRKVKLKCGLSPKIFILSKEKVIAPAPAPTTNASAGLPNPPEVAPSTTSIGAADKPAEVAVVPMEQGSEVTKETSTIA